MEEMLVLQGSSAAFLSSFDDLPKIIPWHFLFMVLINLATNPEILQSDNNALRSVISASPPPPPPRVIRENISALPPCSKMARYGAERLIIMVHCLLRQNGQLRIKPTAYNIDPC